MKRKKIRLLRQIQKMNEGERDFREETIESLRRADDICRTKLDNLLQLKISPENNAGSMLSDEKYKAEKEKLEVELRSIKRQLETADNRMLQAHEDTLKAFNFATRARERFANGDVKIKRDIFMGLGSHLRLLDKRVLLDSPKYLFTFKKMREESPIIVQRVAPTLQTVPAAKTDALYAPVPTLLRGLHEIRTYFLFSLIMIIE